MRNGLSIELRTLIFGKVGRLASEEVVLQLLYSKCMPVLLYGLEVCPLNKSDYSSLDFAINRFFMKLFKTNDMNIISSCQSFFRCELPSVILQRRYEIFCSKISDR